eukprot:1322993-Amorphochlora_amoeboformis.AAC.2
MLWLLQQHAAIPRTIRGSKENILTHSSGTRVRGPEGLMGAYLTRYRYLAHQEKIRKALEAYKRRQGERQRDLGKDEIKRERTVTREAIHRYYDEQERSRYERPLEFQKEENLKPIRWTRGDLLGHGAFGKVDIPVYMGMNLDTGSLMAVKQIVVMPAEDEKEKDENDDMMRGVKKSFWVAVVNLHSL